MIKIKKLNEDAEAAKKLGEKPHEAWDNAKNVQQMDDAAAWGINEATNSNVGNDLQKILKQGTLARFIQAISWEDLYTPNTFIDFLAKNSSHIAKDIVNYVEGQDKRLDSIDDTYVKSRTAMTKHGARTADDIFQALYNGSLDNLYSSDDTFKDAITNCIKEKDTTEKNIKTAKREQSIDDALKNISDQDKDKLMKAISGLKDMNSQTKQELIAKLGN